MLDAPEDDVMVARVPLDGQSLPPGIPLILQVSFLDEGSDPDEFFYDPFADVESGDFTATHVFVIHQTHTVVFHDCLNAMAFQNLYPSNTIAYISLLPKGLIAEGHSLLKAQRAALLCPSPCPAVQVLAPPCLLLDSYVATGFAGAWVGPPLALAHSDASASASSDSFILSPSVLSRGYKSSTAVTSCSSTAVASRSSTIVASIIPPKQHPQSFSWHTDPDGYNVSSLNNYGGHHSAYRGSYPCYASEVQNKMIIMGHQISSCHVLVVRSFFIL
jgi:hypothetical protein